MATTEVAARSRFPICQTPTGVPLAPSGARPWTFGPAGSQISDGTVVDEPICGLALPDPCAFTGEDDVEATGAGDVGLGPHYVVTIDARVGRYAIFCFIHPGIRGTVTVVPDDEPVTTHPHANHTGELQFLSNRTCAGAGDHVQRPDLHRWVAG